MAILLPSGEEQLVEPSELHPPPGDPSLLGIAPTALLYLDEDTLLVGTGDGTVTSLDRGRRRRFSIGFRGAVDGLAPQARGSWP